MKKRRIIFSVVFLSSSVLMAKRSHKAHVHGEGKFVLAAEGKNLEIEMEIPADDIVGFEHSPKTAKQKKAVKDAVKILRQGNKVVILPKRAKCHLTKAEVESPLMKNEHDDDHKHHGKKETHSEFHAKYKFQCEAPRYISRVNLKLFSFFPSLTELNGQAATMDGQFAHELKPQSSTFKLY